MRYDALQELAVQANLHHILLAHHQNDQAETVLLRLLRGAGPIGLAAMAPVMQRQGLSYVRPWLEVDRALILQQRSEEHTSELQSLMRISYAAFCLKKKTETRKIRHRVLIINN